MSLTNSEIDIIQNKIQEVIRACVAVRFYDYNKIINKLELMKAKPTKIFACLYYIYTEHNAEAKTIWDIDENGLVYIQESQPFEIPAWSFEWYEEARSTFDFFLEPLPIFCNLSGCFKIIETGEVTRVTLPTFGNYTDCFN